MPAIFPTQADLGLVTEVRVHWAADTGPARPLSTVTKYIVHDTQGGKYGDEEVLTSAAAPVESCHALIWPEGTLIFMVPLTLTAWTPGNDSYARQSINVEMTGYDNEYRTEAQYKTLAAFFNWCVAQGCPIPAVYIGRTGKPGILGHVDVPDPDDPGRFGGVSNHTDPGPLFSYPKLIGLINDGGTLHVTDTQGPKPFNPNPQGKDVGPGMLDKARQLGFEMLTNEQFYIPDPAKPQPGLGKLSVAWAADTANAGEVNIFMAIEHSEQKQPDGTVPWEVKVVKEK